MADGTGIVFSSRPDGSEFYRIYVMSLNGLHRTVVAGILGDAGDPAVRPDE